MSFLKRLKIQNIAFIMGVVFLLFYITQLILSLGWRMEHDTSILHYIAFLIKDHNFIPYKDILDTGTPGTILLHTIIANIMGLSDLSIRVSDVLFLSLLSINTWFLMRPFGRNIALIATSLFPIILLQTGPKGAFQRDSLAILPISLAISIAFSNYLKERLILKSILIGALFGLSGSFKPQMGIGLPPIIIFILFHEKEIIEMNKNNIVSILKFFSFSMIGFLAIFMIPLLWIYFKGGLDAFFSLAFEIIPFYLQITYESELISVGLSKLIYLLKYFIKFGGKQLILLPLSFGLYFVLKSYAKVTLNKNKIHLLIILTCLYGLNVPLAGQFFTYHWMPFFYFCTLLISFLFLDFSDNKTILKPLFGVSIFLVWIIVGHVRPSKNFLQQIRGRPVIPPKNGRVDKIANYLKKHLKPGDKVQPLDWVEGGSIHAMLESKAVIATPHLNDIFFYMNNNPLIDKYLIEFIRSLKKEPPAYILKMIKRPRLKGPGTRDNIPYLNQFIFNKYQKAYTDKEFIIYKRSI